MRHDWQGRGPSGGQTHRAPLLILAASCLFGLVGSFLPFVALASLPTALFAGTQHVSASVWSNVLGGSVATLFVGLLIVTGRAWTWRDPRWRRRVGWLVLVVGLVQLAGFLLVPRTSPEGWLSNSKRWLHEHAYRREVPAMPPEWIQRVAAIENHEVLPPSADDARIRAEVFNVEFAQHWDRRTPRPVLAIGPWWLATCALLVSVSGAWILARDPKDLRRPRDS